MVYTGEAIFNLTRVTVNATSAMNSSTTDSSNTVDNTTSGSMGGIGQVPSPPSTSTNGQGSNPSASDQDSVLPSVFSAPKPDLAARMPDLCSGGIVLLISTCVAVLLLAHVV